ncbi:unnamed protein product [Echinostoma caproni]|uniref:Solute carrier organic anion transporter family member n=1 Tax=Echinostoma caproni TaxID=27848 RepID=A0A183AMM2_9TREM|nr:unnamed protein product [Echinostoma caproni]
MLAETLGPTPETTNHLQGSKYALKAYEFWKTRESVIALILAELDVKLLISDAVRGFLLVLRRVFSNPIWFGVTFTSMLEQSIVAAFLAFAAKYIQDLFQVPAYMASIHTGAVVVPSSLLGVLSGALIMRHYRPRIDRTLAGVSLLIGGTVVTTIILMLISCPGNRVAGLTATYSGEPWPWLYGPAQLISPNLTAPCNARIPSSPTYWMSRDLYLSTDPDLKPPCSSSKFSPVCWRREIMDDPDHSGIPRYLTFFSPCHAGCQSRRMINRSRYVTVEEFTDCACVTRSLLNPSGEPVYNSSKQQIPFGQVTAGRCPTDCPQYAAFLAVLFMHILLTGMLQNPSNVITLRRLTQKRSQSTTNGSTTSPGSPHQPTPHRTTHSAVSAPKECDQSHLHSHVQEEQWNNPRTLVNPPV